MVKGDGYCFLSSVMKALSVDCGQNVQCESLANQVLDHMYKTANTMQVSMKMVVPEQC